MIKTLFLFLLTPFLVVAQTQIKGVVFDGNTKKPLPFASISTNSNNGTLTDVDGNFNYHIFRKF